MLKRIPSANAEARYASCEDFRRVFEEDLQGLYQLAFLLTEDHQKAERCFVAGLEDCVKEGRVFREWARTWAKRVIVKNAIRELHPQSNHSNSSVRVPIVFCPKLQLGDPNTLGDEEDTRRAIAAAKLAFVSFGRTTKEERLRYLHQLHKAVSARVDDLTAVMIEEYGGVARFARLLVESGANAFAAAQNALQELPLKESWGKTTVTMEPVGVAGLITAWNANALFICLKLASAIAAGCTVVLKPSEMSSLQTRAMVEAVNEAGLPNGVFNVVTGLGTVVGAELVRNPDVAKISFTGSVAVGQGIMRDGAATMKRVTLELGGKSPTILLDDAALDKAIPTALILAFMNSGQACAAGTRLLVPRSRIDEVKRAIRDEMRNYTVGDPADPNIMVGPMVSQKQYERIESYIRKGIEQGAEVLVGGEGHPKGLEAGFFVKPTVFVNVKNDMTIAQEEIFGPVLSVIAYDSEDEAIRIANDSKYGLHSAVLGTDLDRARRVASHLRAGRVVINTMTDDPQAPWGGFKYSGVGREYGKYGIEAFLEPRAILE